ncbi:Epoxyqueuosine reductase [Lentibacillus sp. JNUCC-1]|uniref:tRNA epoxyqueuosine(34) reductase QueG n=1 Tax=Lentibacillus sp. JNUCC-1 TaxID=2654513 RepID=UPI0012E85C7A|nr:tRNA epoxyqueuosine(34) reductase QueG [Lentibacillus sp. JNUCC-1]MUV36663.1 Epoxyqueuosine reductase [Lentibacillus sp. JNUCC-1]
MSEASLKKKIIAYSKSIGIDKIGFTTADVFTALKNRLKEQQELGYQSGFEKGSIEERTEPKRLFTEAQSILSIAIAYPSRMPNPPKGEKGNRRGIFCRASWGTDYHVVLRDKLEQLAAFIKEQKPEAETKIMVDTGELSDRAVAERAGIGFSGKNTAIITPEFGSYVYLGEMLTNISFEPDQPLEDGCGDCTKCLDACPTGALIEGGRLNAQKCLAFLTQTKDFLPDDYRSKIGNALYGYDTCQVVCPYNKKVDFHLHPELEPEPEVAKPKLVPLLTISNRQFKVTFGHVAGSWRGKKPLQRNALLALAHYKETTAVPDIIHVMTEDVRPVMRGTAAWTLGKIGTDEAFAAIKKAMENETDEDVLFEMDKGLQFEASHLQADKARE